MDFNTEKDDDTTFWREWYEHYDQVLRTNPRSWLMETFQELIQEEKDKCLLKLNQHLPVALRSPSAYASHFQDTNSD